MLKLRNFGYGITASILLFPFGASATYLAPPVDPDHSYNDIEICSGKVEGATRTQRSDACSDIIDFGRLSGRSLGAIYEHRAIIRQSRSDNKAAIADYDQSIALNPGRSEVLINRGSAHL